MYLRFFPTALFSACAFFRVRSFPNALFSACALFLLRFFPVRFFRCACFRCAFFPVRFFPRTDTEISLAEIFILSFSRIMLVTIAVQFSPWESLRNTISRDYECIPPLVSLGIIVTFLKLSQSDPHRVQLRLDNCNLFILLLDLLGEFTFQYINVIGYQLHN